VEDQHGRMLRIILHGLQIDDVDQMEIDGVGKYRCSLLHGEHDTAGDCSAQTGGRDVSKGRTTSDDKTFLA
jgi:hypothetical protein